MQLIFTKTAFSDFINKNLTRESLEDLDGVPTSFLSKKQNKKQMTLNSAYTIQPTCIVQSVDWFLYDGKFKLNHN